MSLDRRAFVTLSFATAAFGAQAQPVTDFQGKTIRLVVQFPAGGVADSLARVLAQHLGERLGATVVVDNKPGGSGAVGADTVKIAVPDGLTLLLADSSSYSITPFLKQKMSYDPVGDFAPVTTLTNALVVLVAHLPQVKSMPELIALAKKQPGLSYGSSGVGSVQHLAMEMLKSAAGIDLVHIPYKGTSASMPAVASGEVVVAFGGLNVARAIEKTGKVKALAIITPERSKLAPEIPTFAELGIKNCALSVTFALFAPLKTPPAIVQKLSAEFAKVAALPAFREQVAPIGLEPMGSSPDGLRQVIEKERRDFGTIIRTAGIKED